METYLVGGAIRDELLGLPVQDRDYVVVGATPDDMLAQGFRPVGKDFPVFLHPVTQEEYALARTERKTAPGYKGFVFHAGKEVTLEQDLARRDLTINAMAKAKDDTLFDPFGGRADIQHKILRHIGPHFTEDPVRILRVARFAAKLPDFTVAPETQLLMQEMVQQSEVNALVPERIWQEWARGLMEKKPSQMLTVLRDCGALAAILPELNALWGVSQPAKYHPEIDTGVHVMLAVDYAADQSYSLAVRFATLMHDLGKSTTEPAQWPAHHGHEQRGIQLVQAVCKRLKVPNQCRDLAILATREHGRIGRALELRPATIVQLLLRCDGLRRPDRFADLLQVALCDYRGRPDFTNAPFHQIEFLQGALRAMQAIDSSAIVSQYQGQPQRIAQALYMARTKAVAAYVADINRSVEKTCQNTEIGTGQTNHSQYNGNAN